MMFVIWYGVISYVSRPCPQIAGKVLFLPQRLRDVRQHIFDKDPVPRGGIVDQHVRDRADKAPVLQDRTARHECVQVGTTHFYNFLTVSTLFVKKKLLYCSVLAHFAN